tara:strand:+ start:695 stop:886 length:192 start_codon:yes stop_codon:yes gene_type:complete
MRIVIKYLFNASILMLQLATMGYGLWLGVTESWGMGLFMFVVALLLGAAAFSVPELPDPPSEA